MHQGSLKKINTQPSCQEMTPALLMSEPFFGGGVFNVFIKPLQLERGMRQQALLGPFLETLQDERGASETTQRSILATVDPGEITGSPRLYGHNRSQYFCS